MKKLDLVLGNLNSVKMEVVVKVHDYEYQAMVLDHCGDDLWDDDGNQVKYGDDKYASMYDDEVKYNTQQFLLKKIYGYGDSYILMDFTDLEYTDTIEYIPNSDQFFHLFKVVIDVK